MSNWTKVDRCAITITWEDASIAFVCVCGIEIIVDSESEPKRCDCGRVYRYAAQLQVRDAERTD